MEGVSTGIIGPVDVNTDLPTSMEKPIQNEDQFVTEIAQRVIDSPAYQDALALFKKEPNKQWLNELELIPYMQLDPNNGWFQQITGRYEDRINEAFRYCMERIAILVRDYYTWKESLPSTQANRFGQVGYNAAITGNGLEGSSISPLQSPTADPGSLQAINPVDAVTSLASVITSVSDGFLSWANLYRQVTQFGKSHALGRDTLSHQKESFLKSLNLSEREFEHLRYKDVTSLNKILLEAGYTGIRYDGQSLDDLLSEMGVSLPANIGFGKASIEDMVTGINLTTTDYLTKQVNDNMQLFAKLQYDIYKNKLELEKAQTMRATADHYYNIGYFGDDPEKFGAYMKSVETEIKDLQGSRSSLETNYIESLMTAANNGDTTSAYLLAQYLTGITAVERSKAMVDSGDLYFDETYLPLIVQALTSF